MESEKCKHCNTGEISNKSRGLCRKCQDYLRYHNRLDEYPKADLSTERLREKYGNEIVSDLKLCMYDLNSSLSKIGRKYNFSREQARQFFNNLFGGKIYRASRKELKLMLDTNRKIAQFNPINKAEKTKEGGFIRLGAQTKAVVYSKLLSLGLDTSYPLKLTSYSLITNGFKIEARTGCLYSCNVGNGKYYRAIFSHPKIRTVDFAVAYIPDTKDFYVIPSKLVKGKHIYIRINPRKRKANKKDIDYNKYRNAWYLLGAKS